MSQAPALAGARFVQKRVRWRLAAAIGVAGLAACVLASCSKYEMMGVYPEPARAFRLPKRALLRAGTGARLHGRGVAARKRLWRRLASPPAHAARVRGHAGRGRPDAPWLCLPRPSRGCRTAKLAQADPNLALSQRIKLEYERDCFRRAEIRIRERLLKLQRAVSRDRQGRQARRGIPPLEPPDKGLSVIDPVE